MARAGRMDPETGEVTLYCFEEAALSPEQAQEIKNRAERVWDARLGVRNRRGRATEQCVKDAEGAFHDYIDSLTQP